MACVASLLAPIAGCLGDDTPSLTTFGSDSGGTTMPTNTSSSTPSVTLTNDPSGDVVTGNGTTMSADDTATTDSMTNPTTDPTGPTTDPTTNSTTEPTSGSSGSSSGIPDDCGNGVIDAGEDCDSGNLGGMTCGGLGYDDGALACGNSCAFDVSDCFTMESLQNDNGNCSFIELGCNMSGMGGNPQDILECYQSTLAPPLDVVEVEYSIDDERPLPDAADLVVHEWAGPGNQPGMLAGTVALDPAIDIVAGLYTFTLPTPINVSTAGFCVGLHGEDPADGLRMDMTDTATVGESWFRAGACGLPTFTEASDLTFDGNFCIRPTVTSPNL